MAGAGSSGVPSGGAVVAPVVVLVVALAAASAVAAVALAVAVPAGDGRIYMEGHGK